MLKNIDGVNDYDYYTSWGLWHITG